MTGVGPSEGAALARELEALRDGAAIGEKPDDRLDLLGPDRVRFLHNLVTCEIRELAAGRATRGFVTNVKGGVLAGVEIVALEDRLRLVLPLGRGMAVRDHLEKHRIMDRVEIEKREDLEAIALRGARTPELVRALGADPPGAGGSTEIELGETKARLRREARGREPRFEIEFSSNDRPAIVTALHDAGEKVGLVELSTAAIECARVEDGELAWGVDYDESNFPQETGEEESVSYTKGCYLGQEVVARIHYRGGVQRIARGLRFEHEPTDVGTSLLFEGRAAGRVTSAVRSPSLSSIGLALVHRRVGEPPVALELEAGGRAEIVALPFPLRSYVQPS